MSKQSFRWASSMQTTYYHAAERATALLVSIYHSLRWFAFNSKQLLQIVKIDTGNVLYRQERSCL